MFLLIFVLLSFCSYFEMSKSDGYKCYNTEEEKKNKKKISLIKMSSNKKFQQEWLSMPEFKNWLVQDEANAKCKIYIAILKPGKYCK